MATPDANVGRDELECGEIWSSNRVMAWVIAAAVILTNARRDRAAAR